MQHISTTPFGRRPVSVGLLAAQSLARRAETSPPVNKWAILRDLTVARTCFALSDRDLCVLSALLSFLREDEISAEDAIVFPSNKTLSQRAHGMAESTLRRHISALVRAGVILRHDSPNGKRYAVRDVSTQLNRAFGFDLSPLAHRAAEIEAAAERLSFAAERLRQQRETIVLRLRDCEKLVEYGRANLPSNWDALSDAVALAKRSLRRKADPALLNTLETAVDSLLTKVTEAVTPQKTAELTVNDAQSERHIQYSNKDSLDSEPCRDELQDLSVVQKNESMINEEPVLPLHLVLRSCPEILTYAPGGIRGWKDLVDASDFVRGMIGITAETWQDAKQTMGPITAAITLACILQSFDRIAKPGGYLRTLTRKSLEGAFSAAPMVMALLKAENTRAL